MRYLLITFVRKPNGQIDEQCAVASKLRKSDQNMCNIILDYHQHKVEKCVVEGNVLDTDWDRINEYYRAVYPKMIDELERASPLWVPPEQQITTPPAPLQEEVENQNGA